MASQARSSAPAIKLVYTRRLASGLRCVYFDADMSDSDKQRQRREQAKSEGLCLWCDRPTDGITSLCDEHRAEVRDRYAGRRDAQICVRCPEPAEPGSVRCSACKHKHNERERERRAERRKKLEAEQRKSQPKPAKRKVKSK